MARKQYTFHYIYKTTCKVTENFYVGMHSTFDLEDGYVGSGKRLKNSISKHGKENHQKEILEFLPDRRSLIDREKEIVNEKFLENPMCMNIMVGGEGGFISEEQQRKRSAAGGKVHRDRMKNDPIYREKSRLCSSETIKNAWKRKDYRDLQLKNLDWNGKKHSEETKLNMRKSRKGILGVGKLNSQFGKIWISNPLEKITIRIYPDQSESYFQNGWIKGRNNF